MKIRILSAFFLLAGICCYSQNLPEVASGTFSRFENLRSNTISSGHIDASLADGYYKNKKYAVLYLYDAPMFFDSTTTSDRKEWRMNKNERRLIRENKTKDRIKVGIWNTESRHINYFFLKAISNPSPDEKAEVHYLTIGPKKIRLLKNRPLSSRNRKSLVNELNPYSDSTFSNFNIATRTIVADTSRGGLIPMYSTYENPRVLVGTTNLSTHPPGTLNAEYNPVPELFLKHSRDNVAKPKNRKLFFDYGTETLDPNYKPTQQQVDKIMKLKGYTPINWINKEFPGAAPIETVWNTRFYVSVKFLLGK